MQTPNPSRVSNAPVVIITGAGSGIGRATADLFAEEQAGLVLVGRRPAHLEATAKGAREKGARAITLAEDVTCPGGAERIVSGALQHFSGIDCLVNNAGVAGEGVPLDGVSDALWSEIIETNLTAPFRVMRAVLPVFARQGHGTIVNVSSTAGLVPMRHMAAYAASKAGLIALTRAVARDYGSYGVRCNCVCPGVTLTPMTAHTLQDLDRQGAIVSRIPLGRVGQASDIARMIVFLST
jgi:meso-butanediol dehydrogenase/(S,S)-butanediol dehydrogenase/diacetyl reductase